MNKEQVLPSQCKPIIGTIPGARTQKGQVPSLTAFAAYICIVICRYSNGPEVAGNSQGARSPRLKTTDKSIEVCRMLDTVKCPEEFEPLFAKAQEYVGKYFSQRIEDPTKGTIEVFGERYILVRAASMSIDFFEAITNLYEDYGPEKARNVARSLLFDIAHAIGKMDARNFHKKMGLTDPIEKLSAGPVHFSHSGWAFVDILPESRPTPDEDYYLIYDHPFSFESDAWIKAGKKAYFPVCVMNAGYSSGWCEESFGVTLVAQEIMCKAEGGEVCRFIMAHPSRIDGYIQEYLNENPQFIREQPEYKIPGFFERKVVEEKLRESEEKYRKLFEEALDAIFVADAETGTLVDCNETAARLVGREKSEVIGLHQSILHPPEDIEGQFSETFRRHIERERGQLLEARVIAKDGRTKDVAIKANVLEIGGKKVLQGIFRDVTEQKKAEDALRCAKERAEKSQGELREVMAELKRFNDLTVGRELRIIEIKKEVNACCTELGRGPAYESVLDDAEDETPIVPTNRENQPAGEDAEMPESERRDKE